MKLNGRILQLGLVALLAITACTPTSSPSGGATPAANGSPVKGGSVVIGRGADSLNLDPSDSANLESLIVAGVVHEGLVRFKPRSLEVEPWLAKSWTGAPDGMTWRFELKPNIKFHDGTPFNAAAVAFTFSRFLDPKHEYAKYGAWALARTTFGNIDTVQAVNESTVEMKMKRPFAPLLAGLAGPLGAIVSPTAVQKNPTGFAASPVGTGAFKFVEWVKDDRIVLERFNDYWGGEPLLDKVIFRVIKEGSARALALSQNEITIMTSVDATSVNVINSNKALVLERLPTTLHTYLSPNHTRAPFNDVRVREAIYSAINRDALVKAFFPGGTVAKGVMPPQMLGFDASIEWPKYDPDRAKRLLTEAGHPDGFSTNLLLIVSGNPYMPEPRQTAEAIQSDLAKVGIKVQIEAIEHSAYNAKAKNGDFGLQITGFSPLIPDPWTIMYTQFDSRATTPGTSTNYQFIKKPEIDALNDKGTAASDPNDRVAAYKQLQQILRREVARIDIAHVDQLYGVRADLRGFSPAPHTLYLEKTWLAKP